MTDTTFDVAVVGTGAVGLAAALAFSRDGFATVLIGPRGARRDGRTAALLDPSLRLLADLGIDRELREVSAPLAAMRIVDDTGSLFRPPPATFRASEIGLDAFGRNVENATLISILSAAADTAPGLTRIEDLAESVEAASGRVLLGTGEAINARLVVAADGRGSRLREAAGIPARQGSYPQQALTTILRHERDHEGTSTEFHTRAGPFTLVPLPGRRSSLVWVTNPARAKRLGAFEEPALADAIAVQSHGLLGRVTIDGPRGLAAIGSLSAERLVAGRVALVGEAAHALPPIGAQGLNMGLRDVVALLDAIRHGRNAGREIGDAPSLDVYVRARDGDIRMRSRAVDGLNRALLSSFIGIDAARGFGLGALARIGPLRRAVMRQGLMAEPARTVTT